MEAACKETLGFRSIACMQTTVIAQGNRTAFSKEKSSPVTWKSPEKVSTRNIFPIFPGFLLYYGLALQTSSSFSIRSKRVSISVRFSFAFCSYLSLHLGPLPQIPGNPTSFSPVLTFFEGLFLSLGFSNNREQHKPTETGIFSFYGLLVLGENFQYDLLNFLLKNFRACQKLTYLHA